MPDFQLHKEIVQTQIMTKANVIEVELTTDGVVVKSPFRHAQTVTLRPMALNAIVMDPAILLHVLVQAVQPLPS